MSKIIEYQDIPLDQLTIGKGQVRTQEIGKGIDELAHSIRAQGLLQPIVVCPAQEEGKWEILTGQRRFLAHKFLEKETISAAVLDQRVPESEAKAISITENLMRRKLSGKELTDGILFLYKLYGTIKAVVQTTGLPNKDVTNHIKYPRLLPELKDMVDDDKIDINVALKAQDAAAGPDGEPNLDVAIQLAEEMNPMTGAQRKKLVEMRRKYPEKPIDDIIEDAKTGSKVTQIITTVSQDTHYAIQRFASSEKVNQDEAAATLIGEALVERGFLDG